MPRLVKPKKQQPTGPDRGALAQAWRLYKAGVLRTFGKHKGAEKIEEEWRRLNPKVRARKARVRKALSPPVRK